MFAGEISPDEIWDYVTHLPRNSATTAARFADPETIIPDGDAPEIRLTEYSPEVEAMSDVYDVLTSILAHLSAFTSKKPVRIKPRRRPGEARRKAAQQARRDQARREWSELLAQLGVPE